MTRDEIEILQKHFIATISDDFLFENCDFNKTNKTYSIKEDLKMPFTLSFYPSRLKISNVFTKRQLDRNNSENREFLEC